MTQHNDRLFMNRRSLLAVGTGMTVSTVVPTAIMALDTPQDIPPQQIVALIDELEGDHSSGISAINWSRRHIANKLRVAVGMPVENPIFDNDYTEFYKKTL